MTSSVLLTEELDEATVLLTLNRPERRNALTIELMDALCHQLESLALERQRRVVILRGAGPAFCTGLDLLEAADIDVAERSAECVARTFETLLSSPLICVAAAHGAALAGGAGLLACCDVVVAADDLWVSFPEVRRGLIPALVATVLRDRIRDRDLRELMFVAEPIDAQRALAIGLINRVMPPDRVLLEVRLLIDKILKGAPDTVRQTKKLLRELSGADPSQLFTRALAVHKEARRSNEASEGLAAFQAKRKPNWEP